MRTRRFAFHAFSKNLEHCAFGVQFSTWFQSAVTRSRMIALETLVKAWGALAPKHRLRGIAGERCSSHASKQAQNRRTQIAASISSKRLRRTHRVGLVPVKNVSSLKGYRAPVTARAAGFGAGAEFALPMLLEGQAVYSSDGSKRLPGPPPLPRRVLIIEDNRDAADIMRDVLSLEGHLVDVAYTGPDGLAAAYECKPEIILCDIGLPGMSGYEVAKALRNDRALHSTHLVALTGYALPRDRQRALDAGFGWHVAKPLCAQKLQELLGKLPRLDQRR